LIVPGIRFIQIASAPFAVKNFPSDFRVFRVFRGDPSAIRAHPWKMDPSTKIQVSSIKVRDAESGGYIRVHLCASVVSSLPGPSYSRPFVPLRGQLPVPTSFPFVKVRKARFVGNSPFSLFPPVNFRSSSKNMNKHAG